MKKVHHEEHVDETWLIPYADMLTLLLALFIVMFAMSKMEQSKFEEFKEQFHVIFAGGSGVMANEGKAPLSLPGRGTGKEEANAGGASAEAAEQDTMNEIKTGLETAIQEEGVADRVKVALNNEGLEISIQDFLLFNSGDAEVLNGVHPLLMQISSMIRELDNSVKIAGHTDNVPVSSGKYRSNWELSASRAINVMNFMVENGMLDPGIFSIQAFGEYRPKFDNGTAEGRAKNRRVEIFIIRNYPISTAAK